MAFSRRVVLLAGCAACAATPALAQVRQQAPQSVEAIAFGPPVEPRSTTASPVSVPPVASNRAPAGPRDYRPDNGGPLSGLPYDRKAPVSPPIAPITTLTEAITLAYRTNPQLLSARATARSADFRVPQARSAFGPTLSANGAYTFTRTRAEVLPGQFAGARGWTSTASLILNQPVFTFGRNAAAEAQAIAGSQYQRDVLRVTEAQVLSNVVDVYVSTLRDAQAVTIARENLSLLERQLSDNQKRYDVRDLTQTDLDQTRTRVEFGRAQLVTAEGQLGISQASFLQYVGAPPGDLAPPDLLDIRFANIEAAYVYAEANSGLIRAANAREKISRASLELARADSRPRVDLRGTADYGSVSSYTDDLRTTQLIGQVVLSQPILDSGLRRARVDEAREANQSDWRLLDTSLRETRSAIASAWDQVAASRASLAGYQAAIDAAERAYQGAVLQQRAGDRSTLDVLDLARDLLTVRTTYNATLANEYLARAALLAAAGMLEGPMIVQGLAPYDADEHFEHVRRRGDIPLLTPALSGLDGVANRNTQADRYSRDAGAALAVDAALPLPSAPVFAPATSSAAKP
ncbi:TolC family protein [Sphingomonas aracearum]|uniref:Type I secretion protein TolC n=1 Tax=Sphingomonas aracearum TaxID=2283317 RepID=A0A369VVW1_9SPHN|nr:TolC family protein [Sphingomonas aracearum]RDE05310.1 type I secretion protein TolC [Sphingomonas aracearum]